MTCKSKANEDKPLKIPPKDYYKKFHREVREKALNHALEIRKFEIGLYWKRAAYFWTFIGATLGGYGFIKVRATPGADIDLFSLILSCLGLVFSLGWVFVNKGSKQWQENWENHVDMLEDDSIGPLFKTTLRRPRPGGCCCNHLNAILYDPAPYSVSKINAIISWFVTILWALLLFHSIKTAWLLEWYEWSIFLLTITVCVLICCSTKTYGGNTAHRVRIRKAEIIDETRTVW